MADVIEETLQEAYDRVEEPWNDVINRINILMKEVKKSNIDEDWCVYNTLKGCLENIANTGSVYTKRRPEWKALIKYQARQEVLKELEEKKKGKKKGKKES